MAMEMDRSVTIPRFVLRPDSLIEPSCFEGFYGGASPNQHLIFIQLKTPPLIEQQG